MGLAVVAVVAVLWAFFALWFSFGATDHGWDGECFAGTPVWSLGQATVAAVGLVLTVRAAWSWMAPSKRVPAAVPWFAAACFAGWLAVVVLGNPDQELLPPQSCYGDE